MALIRSFGEGRPSGLRVRILVLCDYIGDSRQQDEPVRLVISHFAHAAAAIHAPVENFISTGISALACAPGFRSSAGV